MFSTQDAKSLDLSNYQLAGLYRDSCDPSNNGYGIGWNAAHDELLIKLRKIQPNGIVVNVKIKTRPGNAHPSYNRTEFTIIGDLYIPLVQ